MLIPLLFMGDVVGRLFREFAVTLAITILISAVVSLTLVPMMSARWLQAPRSEPRGYALQVRSAASTASSRATTAASIWVLDRQTPTLLVALGTLALTVLLYVVIPKGLFPTQDTGQLQARVRGARRPSPTPRMAELQQAGRARDAGRSGGRQRSAPSSASTAPTTPCCNTGRMLINLKPARTAARRR